MSEDNLRRFVSNFLHETQGFSEDTSVDYLITKAKTANSSNDIIKELGLCGIVSNDQKSNEFAKSLFDKVPHLNQQQQSKKRKQLESFNNRLHELERQKSLRLVSFNDSDEDETKKEKKKKKKKERKRKRHKYIAKEDRKDKGNPNEPKSKRRKLSLVSIDGDQRCKDRRETPCLYYDYTASKEEEEIQRRKDQIEKRELEARMKKKDLERRQKLSEEQQERLEEERKREALRFGDKEQFKRARIISQRKYREMRTEKQVYLYEGRVRDEEEYFGDEHLTEKEREKHQISKQILNIAHETIKNRENDHDGYHIPSQYDRTEEGYLDKKARENIMKGRYKDDQDKNNGNYRHEQEKWEESRMRDALGDINNKKNHNLISDKWADKAQREKDKYETILDDQIQFIVDTMKDGKDLEQELKNEIEEEDKLKLRTKEAKKLSLKEFRKTLPVYDFRDDLMDKFEEYQIMIIVAATGSGKTTQIPQYIYEEKDRFLEGDKLKIGITQPRRVAAMSVATRVAQECDSRLGSTVGYSVRFEDKTTEDTRIKYMTDGMLLREFLVDPMLESYGVIMIDEV